jgi:hypothetical protein
LFDTVACASSRRLDANDWGVMTLRNAPLWDGTVRISELIWVERKQKYFCKRGLTPFLKIRSDLPVGLNLLNRFKNFTRSAKCKPSLHANRSRERAPGAFASTI